MSSGNLDKYEYLTGEDLNYKPSIVDQAKFDYSLLSKSFNRGLKKEEKKGGLLKRLKTQPILNFLLLKFGFQVKLVKHSKLKIMLI